MSSPMETDADEKESSLQIHRFDISRIERANVRPIEHMLKVSIDCEDVSFGTRYSVAGIE